MKKMFYQCTVVLMLGKIMTPQYFLDFQVLERQLFLQIQKEILLVTMNMDGVVIQFLILKEDAMPNVLIYQKKMSQIFTMLSKMVLY